jgi:hypothetical protein
MDHRPRERHGRPPVRDELAQRGAALAYLVRLQPDRQPVDIGRGRAVLRDLGAGDAPAAPPAPAVGHPPGGSHRRNCPGRTRPLVVVGFQPCLLRDRHQVCGPVLRGLLRVRRFDRRMALLAEVRSGSTTGRRPGGDHLLVGLCPAT